MTDLTVRNATGQSQTVTLNDDPAKGAKQDTGNASLASILAKLSADPATQTTLAAVLAKIIAAPATEAKQDTIIAGLASVEGHVDGAEASLTAIAGAVAAATPAGENLIGLVGTPGDVISVDLSLDTSAYADGDVLADFQAVADFVRVTGGRALVQSITVLDKDDQGVAFDILSAPSGVSLGAENGAPSISDANAESVQRITRIETSDYIDLGGCKVATKTNIGLVVEAASDSRAIYIGAIIRGAGTYSATGIRLRFGLIWF